MLKGLSKHVGNKQSIQWQAMMTGNSTMDFFPVLAHGLQDIS